MKKLSLKTYSIYELRKLNNDHSLKVLKMLKNNDNPRLLAPIAVYAYLSNIKENNSFNKNTNEILSNMYSEYPDNNENNALRYLQLSHNDELVKFYNSYVSENMRRDEKDIKSKYKKAIYKLQKEKKISNYKVCKLANIDFGNYHSFFQLNNYNRLSVAKLENALNVCLKA